MFKIKKLNKIAAVGTDILDADKFTCTDEIDAPDGILVRSADMRYLGQEYTVRVNFAGEQVDEEAVRALTETFHQLHQQIYGHSNREGEVEIVTLRLVGLGRLDKIKKKKSEITSSEEPKTSKTMKAIFFGKEYDARIYQRKDLISGQTFSGPAIVEEFTTTSVIPPNWKVTIDSYRNMVVNRMYKKEV